MRLLPSNETLVNQEFAVFLDKRSMCSYGDFDRNSLTCNVSLLPHLAKSKNLNIDGMLEHEAREYIANADKIYNIKGTPQSILNALAAIGLHTAEHPARIIEYRDINEKYTTERIYDGSRSFNGTWRYLGTTVDITFTLDKWYQFGVIIDVPITREKYKVVERLIEENKPTRCELKALITGKARVYDGTWRFDGLYDFDGTWMKREIDE